jgi:hypothetical protein
MSVRRNPRVTLREAHRAYWDAKTVALGQRTRELYKAERRLCAKGRRQVLSENELAELRAVRQVLREREGEW